MKKLLITTFLISATLGSNAFADNSPNLNYSQDALNESISVHKNGASLKLGNIDTGGADSDTLGVSVANTGVDKRSLLAQSETAGSITTGNETEVGFSYQHPVNEKFDTNFKLAFRNDTNNMEGQSDGAAMLHFNYKFK